MTASDADSSETSKRPDALAGGGEVHPPWNPPVGAPIELTSPIADANRRSSRASWFVLIGLLLLVVPLGAFVFLAPPGDTSAAPKGLALPTVTDRPVEPTTTSSSAPQSRSATNGAVQSVEAPSTSMAPTTSPPANYEPDLRGYYIVTYERGDYICKEGFGAVDECARYWGGPAPILIGTADLYCSQSYSAYECSPYDRDRYFELAFSGRSYLCESDVGSRIDCVVSDH
jgi:hypothetical protein